MAEKIDPKEVVTIEEIAHSNMYQLEALTNLLERKGILTKAEVLDEIKRLHTSKQ